MQSSFISSFRWHTWKISQVGANGKIVGIGDSWKAVVSAIAALDNKLLLSADKILFPLLLLMLLQLMVPGILEAVVVLLWLLFKDARELSMFLATLIIEGEDLGASMHSVIIGEFLGGCPEWLLMLFILLLLSSLLLLMVVVIEGLDDGMGELTIDMPEVATCSQI